MVGAEGCGFLYRVLLRKNGSAELHINGRLQGKTFDTVEQALEAAQTDYEARIMACLTDAVPVSLRAQDQSPDLLNWAVQRWNAEVKDRPLRNAHRRTLDDVWRQVIQRMGGNDVELLGPRHDDLLVDEPRLNMGEVFITSGAEERFVKDSEAGVYSVDMPGVTTPDQARRAAKHAEAQASSYTVTTPQGQTATVKVEPMPEPPKTTRVVLGGVPPEPGTVYTRGRIENIRAHLRQQELKEAEELVGFLLRELDRQHAALSNIASQWVHRKHNGNWNDTVAVRAVDIAREVTGTTTLFDGGDDK